jgi:hypothetical protein
LPPEELLTFKVVDLPSFPQEKAERMEHGAFAVQVPGLPGLKGETWGTRLGSLKHFFKDSLRLRSPVLKTFAPYSVR